MDNPGAIGHGADDLRVEDLAEPMPVEDDAVTEVLEASALGAA